MAANRDNPDDGRVLRMLDRIAEHVEDYESTDETPPISEDERETVLERHRRKAS